MAASIVLKARHSLVGKSLLPMLIDFKSAEQPDVLARFKKEHQMENYNLEELEVEFRKLTGESARDLISLAGKQWNLEELHKMMHGAIIYANSVGAPKGNQLMVSDATAGPSNAVSVEGGQQVTAKSSSSGKKFTVSSVTDTSDLDGRMKALEQNLNTIQHNANAGKVEEALKNVRVLAGRPKLTSPGVLLASLEVLVECAAKAGHEDSDYYSKALQACRQYENHPDIYTLCLKPLGSSEDKTISNTIVDWMKTKRYELKPDDKKEDSKSNSLGQGPKHPYFPYTPSPMPMQFGPQIYPPPPAFSQMNALYFNPMERPTFRPRLPKKKGVCFYCMTPGHFVNECPKMKKSRLRTFNVPF